MKVGRQNSAIREHKLLCLKDSGSSKFVFNISISAGVNHSVFEFNLGLTRAYCKEKYGFKHFLPENEKRFQIEQL